ncbi:MAG TPA: PD-(D/E)XK nuclease family protein, partial [Candidatus Cloacimonadota bacterium]|nr:PD-(D/E)XK nuclease family protein [Candidatus Cloacimonadota bacterium]
TEHIRFPEEVGNYVFVNQYYYSALEKHLIAELEQRGASVLLLVQAPEESFDKEAMKARALKPEEVFTTASYQTQHITVNRAASEEQMIMSLLQDLPILERGERNALLDSAYHNKAYSKLIPEKYIRPLQQKSLAESFYYRFLQYILKDLQSLKDSLELRFIPLQNVLDAAADPLFVQQFCEQDRKVILDQIMALGADNYLYIDLDLRLFELDTSLKKHKELQAYLEAYLRLLKRFIEVSSINDLIELLTREPALALSKLLSETEQHCSDAPEKLYERLANFKSIEDLGLVGDWSLLFPGAELAQASGILELWLSSVKNLQMSFRVESREAGLYELSNLLDSRNQSFDSLVVLNCMEGILPSGPEPVWILNEAQRGRLGLKTFTDVQMWERYYFFRLLFTTRYVQLYYYQNLEQNIESSSFISELRALQDEALLPQSLISWPAEKPETAESPLYLRHLHKSLRDRNPVLAGKPEALCGVGESNEEFFNLPFDPQKDFGGKGLINGTYYKLENFVRFPILWYISDYSGLREPELKLDETISRKLFGTIIHSHLSELMKHLSGKHHNYSEIKARIKDKKLLYDELVAMLEEEIWRYRIPQNYNWEFLRGILADSIVETVWWFFRDWLPELLQARELVLIPEKEKLTGEESKPKTLFCSEIDGRSYQVQIKAKADLRIECSDQVYIVDFKTGKADQGQLILYELFYYLIDGLRQDDELSSYVCKLLDRKAEPVRNSPKDRDKYIMKVKTALERIVEEGYGIAEKSADRKRHVKISRTDLYREQGEKA